MKRCLKFGVKKRNLLAIAGVVWIIAGVNVARLGINAHKLIEKVSLINLFLSLIVFSAFSVMFYKMSLKHSRRIHSYEEDIKPFWYFFDLRSYGIMVFMMGGGIWLRSSGLVSSKFIAVFYTGIGLALIFAGISFLRIYFNYLDGNKQL